MPMFKTTAQWVEYIQTLHSREIDMTLDRVRCIYKRLFPDGVDFKVISVAGTNGKGSTAELLSSIYDSAGYIVGKFTSPHILVYNERFTLNGVNVTDECLLGAFEQVEMVRGDITITYFEYGLLLALVIFSQQQVDLAILEVGLGGRLDAVNVVDADLAVVTNTSIDHVDWLGDSLDPISLEKIGIARANHPCVIGMDDPPKAMLDYCESNDIHVTRLNQHYNYSLNLHEDNWSWEGGTKKLDQLPVPFGQNNIQLQNAAGVLQVVELMKSSLPVTNAQLKKGISKARLAGRCQVVTNNPTVIIDVSHNEESVACLAEFIEQHRLQYNLSGDVYAVCGMLKDKKIKQSLAHLLPVVTHWSVANIEHERGSEADQIKAIINSMINHEDYSKCTSNSKDVVIACYEKVTVAFDKVKQQLNPNDCLVVFGSFFIVSDIIAHIQNSD